MAATLDLGNLLVHLRMNASQYMASMATVEAKMRMTSARLTQLGTRMSLLVTAPIVAMGIASVKAFASFDDAMTKSLAIMSGVTPTLRAEMESLALEISDNGVTSATDLAKSYFYLASAGLNAEQSMAALGAVEKFAVAGAFDMATATDLATDAQSALGLTVKDAQKNLINMTRVTDVLTGANTLANATTEQFSLALTSQAGPAMKAYGVELEQGVAVLAAYADQGIKAQLAGNMFGRMLRLMTKGFKDNEAVWKRFRINIYDNTGELKPLYEIVGDLSKALEGMSTKQKIAALEMLGFQARSQQAILPLLGLQDRIEEYNKELLKMGGITQEVADKQLQSFSSQMKIFWNQIKNAGREIGKTLSPHIIALTEKIKKLIEAWKELDNSTKNWILGLAGVAAAIGPLLLTAGFLINSLIAIKGALVVAIPLLYAFAKAIIVATASAAAAHPVIAGLILATYAMGKAVQEYIKARQQMESLTGVINEANKALKEHTAVWKELKEELQTTMEGRYISRQVEELGKRLALRIEQLKIINDEYDKMNVVKQLWVGPSYARFTGELEDEIKVLEQRLKTLGEQGQSEFDKIAQAAEETKKTIEGMADVSVEVEIDPEVKKMLRALDFELSLLGKISEERERAIALAEFEVLVQEKYNDDLVMQNKLMEEYAEKFDKILKGKRGMEVFDQKIREWSHAATNLASNIADAFTNGLDRISEGITDLLMKGEADFAAIVQAINYEVMNAMVKSAIGSITGGLFGEKEGLGAEALTASATALETSAVGLETAGIGLETAGIGLETSAVSLDSAGAGLFSAGANLNMAAANLNMAAANLAAGGASEGIGGMASLFGGGGISGGGDVGTAGGISGGGDVAGAGGGISGGASIHTGGRAGDMPINRYVPAPVFDNAPRFHQGLADNEIAAILQKDEVVLSKQNVAELRKKDKEKKEEGENITNNVTINVSAIDARGVAQFFAQNRRMIAGVMGASKRENNPYRRGS